jgi:hypothetical protein
MKSPAPSALRRVDHMDREVRSSTTTLGQSFAGRRRARRGDRRHPPASAGSARPWRGTARPRPSRVRRRSAGSRTNGPNT